MTEFEQKIYNHALKIIPEAEEKISDTKNDNDILIIPFHCYSLFGVFAHGTNLIYNKDLNKFTKIQYRIGLKNCEFNITY